MSKNYSRYTLFCFAVFAFFSLWGCTIINPDEQTPTYIHVDSFQIDGGHLHDIKYVWVYYNNNPVGTFDLPATIPIIATGTGSLQLAPGIAINGRNERPVAYPFYKIDVSTLEAQPGKIITKFPKTSYFDSAKVTVISEFEAGITKFASVGAPATILAINDSLTFEGTGSGMVFLNSPADSSVDSTRTAFIIPNGAAFIEFDYNSTLNVALGMQGVLGSTLVTDPEYSAGVSPNGKWQKFYFNVTAFVNKYPGGSYNLFIKTNVPEGKTSGRLLIDNIKLITF